MWVRSQSKRTLMNCKYFTVDSTNVVIGMSGGNYISLGSYSTEEKALKVLDKIERFVTDLERCLIETDNYSGFHTTRKVVDNVVFQMPQDSEV